MKKICLFCCIGIALIIFVSASVWEGAAATARDGELPDSGLFIATNSFPINTIVDVTNLENGRTTRLIVTSGLDSPGLLATLSKDAANAIGLPNRSLGRIRMSQSADISAFGPTASSRFSSGIVSSGDADHDPAAFVALNGYDLFVEEIFIEDTELNERAESGETIIDLGESVIIATDPPVKIDELPASALSLVPAETRPPEIRVAPDPAFIIPSITYFNRTTPDNSLVGPDSAYIIPPIGQAPVTITETYTPLFYDNSIAANLLAVPEPIYSQPFSAPLISNLEKGKYYLQIAAYSKAETVRQEISKIDSNLPVAIMNAGSAEDPIYRILIGPVNLGESGALLQRFKGTHKDAFLRQGS